ncbi:MAG: SHOCT domain-containing protein, partial [Actinobacteria bacterium]|nr:SHOCT domain-containing protein [Actinomycetota bacterium]
MMCGRGVGPLFRLAEDMLAENRQRRGVMSPMPRPEGERMLDELRQLYARGDLDRDTFVEMRGLAERGELTRADFLEARRQAAEMRTLDSPEAREARMSLSRLQRQEKALERARTESES